MKASENTFTVTLAPGEPGVALSPIALAPAKADYVFTPKEIAILQEWVDDADQWHSLSPRDRAELTERALRLIYKYGWSELPRPPDPEERQRKGEEQ